MLSVPSTLVAYWRFDEGTGTTAYDTATGGLVADNGTLTGASWQSQTNSKLGYSLGFAGGSSSSSGGGPAQYVSVPGGSETDVLQHATAHIGLLGQGHRLRQLVGLGLGEWTRHVHLEGHCLLARAASSVGTAVRFQATINGSSYSVSYTPASINSWHYYTGTYDGSNLRLYVDGVLEATSPTYAGSVSSNTTAVYLGGYLYGGLDEVRIYSTAISQDDITALAAQTNLTVTGLAVTNSSSAASYHVQKFAFGTSGSSGYQYGDGPTWNFPSPGQYLGSTFIQTANADNLSTSFSMSFAINTPCVVYVLYDTSLSSSPPLWLTLRFTNTTKTISNSNSSHSFTIWKSICTAGTVYLGANYGNASSEMYSVLSRAAVLEPVVEQYNRQPDGIARLNVPTKPCTFA